MKVAILGAGGQLAFDLARVLKDKGYDLVELRHRDLDICEGERVYQVLGDVKPDIVINTAAFHRVDESEERPALAFEVNALGARNVALACAGLGCVLVHISTDYVFDGRKREPYTEGDLPNPLNVYGVSKLAGEHFVRSICEKHFIVRTSGLYGVAGSSGKGRNFVETMLRLAREGRPIRVVDDQVLSPTYTLDLARRLVDLLGTEAYGIYHITNSGSCSWYEFASRIFQLVGLRPDLTPTTSEAYGARARRPPYSVLSGEKLRSLGLGELRPWPEALEAYLKEKGHLGSKG